VQRPARDASSHGTKIASPPPDRRPGADRLRPPRQGTPIRIPAAIAAARTARRCDA